MSGYILNRDGMKKEENRKFYRRKNLELMTTYQLREICRKERLIQGLIDPMDKEELIHVIMRYRGTREELLIYSESKEGRECLEQLFIQGKIKAKQDKALHIPSKIIVYEGLLWMKMTEYIFLSAVN